MTSALGGCEWSAARPGCTLPLGKTQYPLYRRLGGPQGQSGQARKISSSLGFDPRTVQSIVSRYTDWATRPTMTYSYLNLLFFTMYQNLYAIIYKLSLFIHTFHSQASDVGKYSKCLNLHHCPSYIRDTSTATTPWQYLLYPVKT
jgi:hypothetical protein